jgi:nucleoside diphosphate kinase
LNSVCTNALADGPIVVLELMGDNAQNVWNSVIGVTDVSSEFGQEVLEKMNKFLLQDKNVGSNTALYNDSTCCIIKPHIVASGMAGAVIYEIQKAGFDVNAIQAV